MAVGVNQWLRQRWKFEAPTEWLEACVDWIQQESSGTIVSGQQLNNQVLEQWLLCDLTEVGAGSLPPGLSQQATVRLTGHYCLQIISTRDVSTPYYSQLQKLQGTENENVGVTATQFTQTQPVKSGRMLMFDMTDGCQNIRGMEYKQIPGIDANITPGTKVVISGPVLCRLGVLMITKDNWNILGGEVDSLAENTQINILQKTLQEQAAALTNPQRERGNRKKTFKIEPNTQSKSSVCNTFRSNTSVSDSEFRATQPAVINRQHIVSKVEPPDDFLDNLDPEELEALEQHWQDDDMIMETAMTVNQPTHIANQSRQQNRPASSTSTKGSVRPQPVEQRSAGSISSNMRQVTGIQPIVIKPDPGCETGGDLLQRLHQSTAVSRLGGPDPGMLWDDDDDDFDMVASALNENRLDTKPKSVTQPRDESKQQNVRNTKPYISSQVKPSTSVKVKPEFDDFEAVDSVIAEQPAKRRCFSSVTLDTPPYTYLLLVQQNFPYQNKQHVYVKAYVSTLSSRLEHNAGRFWSLSVKLNDGTASVDADLGDKLLAALIGFTAAECHTLREQAKYNKDVKLRIAAGMKKCQTSLVQISGLLQLELSPDKLRPTVVRCVPFTERNVLELRNRLSM